MLLVLNSTILCSCAVHCTVRLVAGDKRALFAFEKARCLRDKEVAKWCSAVLQKINSNVEIECEVASWGRDMYK